MKNKILTFFFCLFYIVLFNSQTVVINEKLLTQITKNQAVRLASNQQFFDSYEKQQELYDNVKQKIAQVVAIQEFIYSNLVNVNMAIKQGKQLYYLTDTFVQIGQNANKVLTLTQQYPEYAILLNRYYIGAIEELLKLKTELLQNIMREDADFLMDPYDRQGLIKNLAMRANLINGNLFSIILRLQNVKKIPYIYQIPTIGSYVNLDRKIVNDIIKKFNNLF